MLEVDSSKTLLDLEKFYKEVQRKLKYMVQGFSYHIAQTAISETPLGNLDAYLKLYQRRANTLGLEVAVGFARGSWQVSQTGQFKVQELYTVNSGSMALSLVKSELSDYQLGQTLYIGNKGYYIGMLEGGYSNQAPMGIMKPTLESILATYKIDLVRLYNEG